MDRLKDKVAVVTGSGAGIGRAIAQLFAAEGAHVFVTDVNGESASAVADSLKGEGLKATAMTVDVSRGQDVSALFREVERAFGRADVVVNNAGLNVRSDFRHLSDADWVKIREVNLDGVVRIARDAFELLKASGAGSLVNVSSIMGQRGLRQLAGYSATKGAVTALTKALAVEYASYNIRVNSVAPGYIDTALTERFLKNPFVSKALLDKTPMRRFGTPEEIARATLFFASDDSAYVTGAELAVDGGMTAGL
ncbi:glucose 1-dehydrogenase [Hyphomicrobium sp. LHD-15]|uniref:SDR family NAD(P)-dependent oxidoreductase n=1 Tax=Hyphomicrobium sp. LHD-15 TaxID=3072142 RepID=UPI0028105C02|nr:glucose 1-dehydrogenase [Hyphomicrobium sp. LHD-15]MDQ8699695.1 glucose 1-dehydrogenase [Hyphomicrobium sp. LHD-15]